MSLLSASAMFAAETAATLFEYGLSLARIAGLPVSTWQPGDPTRTIYMYLAETLAALETSNAEYVKSGFLSSATGDWLTVLASEVYGVERVGKTYATPSVTLENTGGAYYEFGPGDVTVRSSTTGRTYHNTSEGVMQSGSGNTVTLDFEADEAGSDSTIGENEIDEIVTDQLGLEVQSNEASVASDEQSDESLREQCRATLGALSPNGPPDAYEYVARNPDLTGVLEVTRAQSVADDADGNVIVYIAGADGTVSDETLAAVQEALERWATPLTVGVTAVEATPVEVDIAVLVHGDDLPDDWQDAVETALNVMLSALRIGGKLSLSTIIATVQNTLTELGASNVDVDLDDPSANITLEDGEVLVPGDYSIVEGE